MIDLTSLENRFLDNHNIKPTDIYDGRGQSGAYWKKEAKKYGSVIVLSNDCTKGHRLKLRSGHCAQCKPEGIYFQFRYYSKQFVYIAASMSGMIYKVGTAKDIYERQITLKKQGYGGYYDWEIIAHSIADISGEIEVNIHRDLYQYQIYGSYRKGAYKTDSREMFKAPLPVIWGSFVKHTNGAANKQPSFSKYEPNGSAPNLLISPIRRWWKRLRRSR